LSFRFVAIIAKSDIFTSACCPVAQSRTLTFARLPNLHDDKALCKRWQEFHDGGNFFLATKTATSSLLRWHNPLRWYRLRRRFGCWPAARWSDYTD
jgi:hypothetical protein